MDGESKPHVLVLEASKNPDDFPVVSIECPGIEAGGCRTWWECQVEGCEPDGDGESHGVEHRMMAFGWGLESEDCWVQHYDRVCESVEEMFDDAEREMAPGRYLVEHEVDEEWMHLHLIGDAPVVAAGSGGEEGP